MADGDTLQVVRAFLSGRMSGIGDAVHHLELWGYRLHHVQQAADEYDYAVVNLKDDLRNGIRLAKLYQLLTGETLPKCDSKSWFSDVRVHIITAMQGFHANLYMLRCLRCWWKRLQVRMTCVLTVGHPDDMSAGLPSLLHPSAGKWQLWLNPVCEQQRVENVGKVLDKFAALGVLPPQGQVCGGIVACSYA